MQLVRGRKRRRPITFLLHRCVCCWSNNNHIFSTVFSSFVFLSQLFNWFEPKVFGNFQLFCSSYLIPWMMILCYIPWYISKCRRTCEWDSHITPVCDFFVSKKYYSVGRKKLMNFWRRSYRKAKALCAPNQIPRPLKEQLQFWRMDRWQAI